MRFLSLFAGIGGFDLGLERAGHECAGQIELDGFCRRVLAARFGPHFLAGDVRLATDDGGWGRIDLLCGGFPCQDLSVAGRRAGLAGERSGLFYEILRIQNIVRAPWGLFENVPGLFSSHGGRDMAAVLEGLRQCWPVVGYRVLDSRYFGVPQRRRRIFFVCGPTERGVEAVLFEPEGGGGDSQSGGEAGAGFAREVARSITGTCYKRHDEDTDTLVTATETGSGWWTEGLPAMRAQGGGTPQQLVTAATLNSGGNAGGFRTEPGEHLVAHALSAEGHDASEDGTGRGTPLAWNWQSGGDVRHAFGDPSLHAGQVPAIGVRRLTPTECERLQGFPDGWTCLCLPLAAYAADPDSTALACKCSDSPRYRALGNAVTVNVVEWLARRFPC